MLANCTTLFPNRPSLLAMPEVDISLLLAKVSRCLWVDPPTFIKTVQAVAMAHWALQMRGLWQPALPKGKRRGPKPVYQDSSIMVMALVQIAWQMGYEEVVDYLRIHPEVAQVAGFCGTRVIGVSQYWERRRALGILPFWFFFVAMVWQLLCWGIIKGTDVILDGIVNNGSGFMTMRKQAGVFPNRGKGRFGGTKSIRYSVVGRSCRSFFSSPRPTVRNPLPPFPCWRWLWPCLPCPSPWCGRILVISPQPS